MVGLPGADTLEGDAGDDVLIGGPDGDRLIGGTGADVFAFDRGAGASGDVVADFASGEDLIWIEAGLLGVAAGALDLSYTEIGRAARQDDTRLLYDPRSGEVRFDIDGAGGAEAELLFTFEGGDRPTVDDVLIGLV